MATRPPGYTPPLSVSSPFTVENAGAAAADHAYLEVKVSGTSGGDPHVRFTIPGGDSYYIGQDNDGASDDKLIIGSGTAVGTNAIMVIWDGGTGGGAVVEVGTAASVGSPVLRIGCATGNNAGFELYENNTLRYSFVMVGASDKFGVFTAGTGTFTWYWNSSGDVELVGGTDMVLDTVTGTKIGTATNQLLGFYNATPVVQQAGTGETTGFTAGVGTGVNDDSTFTGNVGATAYRISDVVKALKNLGLMAA